MPVRPEPVLVLSWGNPSRGDDAIGPVVHRRLEASGYRGVELLTDFQLQIEHVVDLEGRERILFVDASVSVEPPFRFCRQRAERDSSYTTHALSPGSLLSVYEQVHGSPAPDSFLLSIRGYEFGLGLPVSGQAEQNIGLALAFVRSLLEPDAADPWRLRRSPDCRA